jgi:carboxylesterase type B
LPVIFYIHGGGFQSGGAKWIEPHILLDEDVILVTIHYRLGIFGFLTLEQPDYSGNMGLKDQLLALQWVNANIQHFGGDKRNITIYGHSAGATSVDFHLLSPRSHGLYQRAIATGGSVYNQFAQVAEPRLQLEVLINRTAAIVFNTTVEDMSANRDKIISWLHKAKWHEILKHTFKSLNEKEEGCKAIHVLWAPIKESKQKLANMT